MREPSWSGVVDLLLAAHSDLTTGETLSPEQCDSIANAVSDALYDVLGLVGAYRDRGNHLRDALRHAERLRAERAIIGEEPDNA